MKQNFQPLLLIVVALMPDRLRSHTYLPGFAFEAFDQNSPPES